MEQQYDAESGNPLCSLCGGVIRPSEARTQGDNGTVHQSCPEERRETARQVGGR
jgi:hypothetical protein